jgi:DNA mismatch endonuclease (patch repair protein)
MSDVLTPPQRSFCMSRIRAKDTKPEVMLRSALWRRGLRFRVHYPLVGRPDIAFTRSRTAVFVDGCFWHCCPEHGAKPKSNAEFWNAKLAKNKQRDIEVNNRLEIQGWQILRFWEHEVRDNVNRVANLIASTIKEYPR